MAFRKASEQREASIQSCALYMQACACFKRKEWQKARTHLDRTEAVLKPADDKLRLAVATLRAELSKSHERQMTVEGKLAKVVWQHIIKVIPGKRPYYLDLDDGTQIVVYAKPGFHCQGRVRVSGKVVEVRAKSKRPSDEEIFSEHHIDVDDWKCLP
jgi:hypothetical protein